MEGEEFTAEVVARVQGLDEQEVIQCLSGPLSRQCHLVVAHSLQRQGAQRLSRYRFRHCLFQTYLYHSLDEVEQARVHEAVGATLETLHEGHDAELAALAPQLAWHFQAAGLAEKAVDYLLRAGRRAYWLSAPQEAVALYRRGLALLETQPESDERARRELDLQLALNTSLLDVLAWGAPEQTMALTRAYQLGQRLGEPARLLPTLQALSDLSRAQGKHEQALAFARQLLSLAEQAQEPAYVVFGHHAIGLSCVAFGDLRPARAHMEQALALFRRQQVAAPGLSSTWEPDVGVNVLVWLPSVLWLLGYPDQALARSREALALAQELAHAPALAAALSIAGASFHVMRREGQAVREYTERLQRLVTEKNLEAYQPWVNFYQGWLQVNQGQTAEGIARMRASMASVRAFRPYQLTMLAGACLQAGQVEAGWQTLDEALALVEQTNARSNEAEMHRLRGELLLKAEGGRMKDEGGRACPERSEGMKAEDCFQQAIAVARRQQARSWELRATMSLARLWQRQGRAEEAQATLAEAYDWFTEGFNTPDLVEARALLAELSPTHQDTACQP